MIKRHTFIYENTLESEPHFDLEYRFKLHEMDNVKNKIIRRMIHFEINKPKTIKDSLRYRLNEKSSPNVIVGDVKELNDLILFCNFFRRIIKIRPQFKIRSNGSN